MYIFYGAGIYAEKHLEEWKAAGKVPDFFADGDSSKWGKMLCGIPIISPEEMMNKISTEYDNIYISVRPGLYNKIHKYLTEDLKIPKEKIVFADDVYYGKGCKYIGTRIQFFGEGFKTCCTKYTELIKYDDDINKDFTNYKTSIRKSIQLLEKGIAPNNCDKCSELINGFWTKNPQIKTVGFDSDFADDKCNFKCCYCDVYEKINDNNTYTRDIVSQIESFEKSISNSELNIIIASGEMSICSWRKPVIEIAKRNNWWLSVFTNASVYMKELEEISNRASLNVSVDAGTAETFAKVKGVNCFGKVCENLQKYRDNGIKIDLKYIMLEGINDNQADVIGFIELAKKINAEIYISCNSQNLGINMQEKTFNAAKLLVEKLKDYGLKYNVMKNYFTRDDLKKLGITE
jgi:pyruvate-formate lyase-activating enzyme